MKRQLSTPYQIKDSDDNILTLYACQNGINVYSYQKGLRHLFDFELNNYEVVRAKRPA